MEGATAQTREAVRAEAARARGAVASLADEPVAAALADAAEILRTRRDRVLEANEADRRAADPPRGDRAADAYDGRAAAARPRDRPVDDTRRARRDEPAHPCRRRRRELRGTPERRRRRRV